PTPTPNLNATPQSQPQMTNQSTEEVPQADSIAPTPNLNATPHSEPINPISNMNPEPQPELQTPSQETLPNQIPTPTPTSGIDNTVPESNNQMNNIGEETIQGLSNTETEVEKKNKSGKLIWILVSVVVLALVAIGIYAYSQTLSTKTPITTFEECIASPGSIMQESYPPVCLTKDGLSFVAEFPPVEEPTEPIIEKTLAEDCYEQASGGVECPEGTVCVTNPASTFCECMGGEVKIMSNELGEYGMCLIDGNEYNEWEYYRSMSPVAEEPEEEIEIGDGAEEGSPFGNMGNAEEVDYILDSSEGTCTTETQCVWESQGCGGGHGICTNEPAKYEGVITTCEVNPNFPSNLGYSCGCIETIGQCGWKK
ncbi:DUF333 domain-containing protein, partial [Patescibacteria group bacterium]|nr:DUF333 domain-containing protein [Patescibacteria group bacterium]